MFLLIMIIKLGVAIFIACVRGIFYVTMNTFQLQALMRVVVIPDGKGGMVTVIILPAIDHMKSMLLQLITGLAFTHAGQILLIELC